MFDDVRLVFCFQSLSTHFHSDDVTDQEMICHYMMVIQKNNCTDKISTYDLKIGFKMDYQEWKLFGSVIDDL